MRYQLLPNSIRKCLMSANEVDRVFCTDPICMCVRLHQAASNNSHADVSYRRCRRHRSGCLFSMRHIHGHPRQSVYKVHRKQPYSICASHPHTRLSLTYGVGGRVKCIPRARASQQQQQHQPRQAGDAIRCKTYFLRGTRSHF